MFARWKSQTASIATFVILAALAGDFLGERVAHAQDYVDVGVVLEVPETGSAHTQHIVNVIVVNNGARPAYDVEAVVNIVYPDQSHFNSPREVPLGNASLKNNRRTLSWSIPALGGLQRELIAMTVTYSDGTSTFDKVYDPHEYSGSVTTSSFESDLHKGNNTAQVWAFNDDDTQPQVQQVRGNYWVRASVDEQQPAQGDTVNFTISAGKKPGEVLEAPPIDLRVDITLTDGLTATGTPNIRSTGLQGVEIDTPTSVSYSNGVFNIGTQKYFEKNDDDVLVRTPSIYSVTLPLTVASDAAVSEQCLTATLEGNPPPGTGFGDDDIADNVAKACLRGPEPLTSGQVDVFTIYPCVGITDAPCDSSDDIRVHAVSSAYSDAPIPSGTTVFWLDPLKARIYDGHTNASQVLQSVNNENTVSWQTAVDAGRRYKGGLASGVELYYSRTPFVGKTSGWAGLSFGISAKDVNGNTPHQERCSCAARAVAMKFVWL